MGTGIAPSEDGEERQGAPTHEFPVNFDKKVYRFNIFGGLADTGYKTKDRGGFNLLLFFL